MPVKRRPTREQIQLLKAVDAPGSGDAAAIHKRARRKGCLYSTSADTRAALNRLADRGYVHRQGSSPIEYHLTPEGRALTERA